MTGCTGGWAQAPPVLAEQVAMPARWAPIHQLPNRKGGHKAAQLTRALWHCSAESAPSFVARLLSGLHLLPAGVPHFCKQPWCAVHAA